MMTVTEFIGYFRIAKDKKAECQKRVVKKYIPFAEKMAKCQALAKSTMEYKETPEAVPVHKQNTISRYILFATNLIRSYTDIEIPDDDFIVLYDTLKEAGAFEMLIQCIPEDERKEYTSLLNMAVDDYIANERDLVSYFENKIFDLAKMSLLAGEKDVKE